MLKALTTVCYNHSLNRCRSSHNSYQIFSRLLQVYIFLISVYFTFPAVRLDAGYYHRIKFSLNLFASLFLQLSIYICVLNCPFMLNNRSMKVDSPFIFMISIAYSWCCGSTISMYCYLCCLLAWERVKAARVTAYYFFLWS
jgi:hypothetical protein